MILDACDIQNRSAFLLDHKMGPFWSGVRQLYRYYFVKIFPFIIGNVIPWRALIRYALSSFHDRLALSTLVCFYAIGFFGYHLG